ncbi:MAG: S8 family serine peptidase, partial [Bacteroidetes bacterium]|nr:S8 family serine peptidase [Bacteroidota bacterium]
MKLTNKLFKISLLLFVSFVLVMSCSDSPTSTENDDNNDERITDQPISELPGDENESVVNATYNLSAPSQATNENISTIEEDGIEQRILRTEVEVVIDPEASSGQLNSLLKKYDAVIVDMLEGESIIILQIPDPGDSNLLNELITNIQEEEIVNYVLKSILIEEPRFFKGNSEENEKQKIPDFITDVERIDHHLSIRSHGVWNIFETNNSNRPNIWLVIADYFGDGEPKDGYKAAFDASDFATGNPHSHGYHVLGIIAGMHNESDNLSTDLNEVIGGYRGSFNVRAIDLRKTLNSTWPRRMNVIIRSIRKIYKDDNNAKIILNTSLNSRSALLDNEYYAFTWIDKVRGSILIENMEDKFIHFTSAGNFKGGSRYRAKDNSMFAFAGLENPSFLGITYKKLENVFVVENRVNTIQKNNERPVPGCANFNSIMGGNLSAIGTKVYSFGDCLSYDSNGDCIQHASASKASPMTGTSMATPQAASLAANIWAMNSDLEAFDVIELIKNTTERLRDNSTSTTNWSCNIVYPQPVVDAYTAVLAAGGDNARKTLLDVNEDGSFNEEDIEKYLAEFEDKNGELEYGRYDLNGSGQTGGDSKERFDLNDDIEFGTVSKTIQGNEIEFNENELTDEQILCYYSYSDLFEGDEQARDNLLEGVCYESFSKPTVTTNQIENITSNSAEVGGEVTDNGGKQVTTRGVCWSTSEDPSTNDECTSKGEGTGRFSSTLTDLSPETEYFVRAFATNSEGTSYGVQRDFITTEESQIGLVLDPKDLLIEPGSSQITEATVSRTNFKGEVTLSVVSSLPSGVTAEIDQPGTGNTGSIEFLLDEGHETFEDYEVEIQASGEDVK